MRSSDTVPARRIGIRYPVTVRRRENSLLVLLLCTLVSVGVHLGGVVVVAQWWAAPPAREAVPKERLVRVEFTPEPKAKPPEPEPESAKPKPKPKPKKKKKRKEKEIELDELEEPEPEPEPEPVPKPKPKPEEKKDQPPPEYIAENMKMVEQPDELDEKDSPEDANFLSNVNRDVTEETRAKVTNLEKDALKAKGSQLESSDEKTQGTARDDVIAQAQEQKSAINRQAPNVRPERVEQRPEQNDPKPQSMLAMRELEQRDHRLPEEAHEALVSEADDGAMKRDQTKQASLMPVEQQARIDRNDKTYKFKHSSNDLEALFGKDKIANKDVESQSQSKTKGVWDGRREHYQSPLENFIPEVKTGNQTALRSRKHPFARYIARMHRGIHDAWAWNFLDQLDTRGPRYPLNSRELWTRVEIVLKGDGTIEKVITVRHSGKTAFDAAAREIIYSAGPYPDPPKAILSGDGKVYIHWAFHRDERACGTFGAQPFILDGAGRGERPDAARGVRGGRGKERRLKRGAGKPSAPKVAEGPALPPGDPHAGHKHPAEPPAKKPSELAPDPQAMAMDPAAKKTADRWLYHFWKGNIGKAVATSSLPFYSGNTVVARSREQLKEVLTSLSSETKSAGKPKAAKVFTAGGLRKVFGSVPAGVQEGESRVYALTKVAGDYVVLMLEKKFGAWRVVGMTR